MNIHHPPPPINALATALRMLYYNTDSVIYLTQPDQSKPRLGNYIGNLTDELGGEHIRVFVREDPRIIATKPAVAKWKSKYAGLH